MKKVKIGSGVLCYRYNHVINKYEFLLVCKSYSNEFIKILTGRYKITKNSLDLNKLSVVELYMIRNFHIKDIYYKYFNVDLEYMSKKNKDEMVLFVTKINDRFNMYKKYIYYSELSGRDIVSRTYSSTLRDSVFLGDIVIKKAIDIEEPKKINDYFNNVYLESMLCSADNNKWEIPKGSVNKKESALECAIRELVEETNLDVNHLYVYDNYKKIETKRYTNSVYKVIYFLGKYNDIHTIDNINDFISIINRENSNEVVCCKWFTFDEIKYITIDNTKRKFIVSYYKYIKKNS